MISKTIAGMCVLGFAANCAAQLQEYSFDEPYRAPSEASITCFDGVHIAPDYEIMYFDIRLPPSSQPTGSFSGTFVIDGDCDAGHVCVGDLCRKLACQTQPSCSYAPTRPCEDAGDCADGHVCDEDARCRKASCL